MNKRYRVTLTAEERKELKAFVRVGKGSAGKLRRARILLKADQARGGPGWADQRIAELLECGVATIERIRQRFVEEGLGAVYQGTSDGPLCPGGEGGAGAGQPQHTFDGKSV